MKVLLAIEGSEFSQAAVEKFCLLFAKAENMQIRIISVAVPAVIPAEPWAISGDYISKLDEASRKEAAHIVAQGEKEIRERFSGSASKITTAVETGSPDQVIVEEAERWGADLIVTGSHGHGFWKRAWLGSVSNAVVHHAPCSVLIVKSNDI